MHDVVVMAVRKAVRAATMTFTAISMMRFFILVHLPSVKDSESAARVSSRRAG